MPKITIVMPTYNQGKFIRESVNSILMQTFQDFGLIIVDDGSTDNTPGMLFGGGAKVKHIRKENGGTGSALNEGFKHSTSKYETWFSSDNILYPDALQEMYNFLETHPEIDYIYCNCEIGVMDHSGLIETKLKNITDEVSQECIMENLFHHYFLGIVWLWRRELREKSGDFQLEPCEDYDMVMRMYQAGGKFAYLPKCLGWFRRHYENMSYKLASSPDRDFYSKLVQQKARQRAQELTK